jgi:hypothetical protein
MATSRIYPLPLLKPEKPIQSSSDAMIQGDSPRFLAIVNS